MKSIASALPEEVQRFLNFQLTSIINANRAGVSVTLAISIVIALWSASGGMAALISGIHVAHEADEPKGFVTKRGKAFVLTLGAIVVVSVVVVLVSALPSLIDNVLGGGTRTLVNVVRWPVAALVMVASIGLLYRLSVGQAGRWFGIVSEGSPLAAFGWLVLSILFAFYTANFSHYAKTYGSLATIVVRSCGCGSARSRCSSAPSSTPNSTPSTATERTPSFDRAACSLFSCQAASASSVPSRTRSGGSPRRGGCSRPSGRTKTRSPGSDGLPCADQPCSCRSAWCLGHSNTRLT